MKRPTLHTGISFNENHYLDKVDIYLEQMAIYSAGGVKELERHRHQCARDKKEQEQKEIQSQFDRIIRHQMDCYILNSLPERRIITDKIFEFVNSSRHKNVLKDIIVGLDGDFPTIELIPTDENLENNPDSYWNKQHLINDVDKFVSNLYENNPFIYWLNVTIKGANNCGRHSGLLKYPS